MSAAESSPMTTALRSLEMRSRSLPLDAQMVECVDLLQAPDLVVEDLRRSVDAVVQTDGVSIAPKISSASSQDRDGFFYPARELFVNGKGAASFTCLATAVEFVDEQSPEMEVAEPWRRPIDYAAVTCEAKPFPVLGFAQSAESESAYPLILRAISTLVELVKPRRFDALDRDVYRGLLGPAPLFDLALVLWDDESELDPRRPLCELSRDLAEVLKATLEAHPGFPPVLNDIVCLRMNPKRFDARMRFVWRV